MLGLSDSLLGVAEDHRAACAAAVDELARNPAYKPSVYLERGGRLRCQAARTYLQVFDGIPPGIGVIGRTFVTGEVTITPDVAACDHYLEITPGVKAEICTPIQAGDAIIGVLSVESLSTLTEQDAADILATTATLGARLAELGGGLRETPAQRLVRHATRLSDLTSRRRVEREVLEAATDVANMDSAVLLATGPEDQVTVMDAIGPLGQALSEAPNSALQAAAGFVASGTSCFTVGEGGGQDFKGLALLRDAGACSLAILSLSTAPSRVLLIADSIPHEIATDSIELLELLCAHAASALRASDLVKDLRVQAATDALTGLGHHRAFHARLQARQSDHAMAVLVVDLDRFKSVNDTDGHVAGDRLLREVASVMQTAVREDDALFRIGGDEFSVLAEARDEAEALEIGTRIVEALDRHTDVTASVGVSLSEPGENLTQALLRADRALYAAKAAGRNCAKLSE